MKILIEGNGDFESKAKGPFMIGKICRLFCAWIAGRNGSWSCRFIVI